MCCNDTSYCKSGQWLARCKGKTRSGPERRHFLYFYFYKIHVDSTLPTCRIGQQKFSCLQFASFAHNVGSKVMDFVLLYKFSIDVNDIVVLFFFCHRNNSKRHALCLFINVAIDRVPWQQNFCKILRENHLLLYCRLLAISRIAEKVA